MDNGKHAPFAVSQTMLIVDDDFINRSILEHIFSPYYQIEEAEDGKEGLERILHNPERLCAVLLDVVMPQMDGIEVLKQLKKQGADGKDPGFSDHRGGQRQRDERGLSAWRDGCDRKARDPLCGA